MTGVGTRPIAGAPAPARRRKRSECEPRIIEAARAVFAEQDYDSATTREIARRAGVSETLLFRYFGSKAGLFDRLLFAPIGGLLNDFLSSHSPDQVSADPIASTRAFLTSLLTFVDDNRTLLASFAARRLVSATGGPPPVPSGFEAFYDLAAAEVRRIHAQQGTVPDVAPDTAVRLSLGMVMASILFADWLFSGRPPEREHLVDSLAHMLVHATTGATARNDGQEEAAR